MYIVSTGTARVALTRMELNMLQCATRGRLVRYNWTTSTIESVTRRGLMEADGPWLHITADGRNALAQIEEAS